MKRILLLGLLSLLSTAGAVSISGIQPGFKASFSTPEVPEIDFTLTIPAAFPKAEERLPLSYNCQDGFGGPASNAEAKAAGVKFTATGVQVAGLKLSCEQTKLTFSYPKLMGLLTIKTPGVDALESAIENQHLTPVVWSSKRDGLAWVVSGDNIVIFALKNGKITVVRGTPGQGAVALSQGGAPQALWVYGAPSKAVRLDPARPFTLHYSRDNGDNWINLTVNTVADSFSSWGSAKVAGGPAPMVDK